VALVLGLEHVLANRFYRRNTNVAMDPTRPSSLVAPLAPPPVPTAASTNGSPEPNGKPLSSPPPLPSEPKQPAPATVG
jgi:hypothetical protein